VRRNRGAPSWLQRPHLVGEKAELLPSPLASLPRRAWWKYRTGTNESWRIYCKR